MSGKKVSETKWCAYCGTQAPSGAVYCPRCGEPIDTSTLISESISSGESLVEEAEETGNELPTKLKPLTVLETRTVSNKGMIRGLVTGESRIIRAPLHIISKSNIDAPKTYLHASNPYHAFAEVYFVMKLEENIRIRGGPDEILASTSKFGYFGKGDKVILQGTIFKIKLKQRSSPSYTIHADHFYNESLHIGDEGLRRRKQVLFEGTIRGLVTRESRTRVANYGFFDGAYFAMKLENIGTGGVPDEILVRSSKPGYFRIGDKVILQGKILEAILKRWGTPMYLILADH